jgi:hypothetical protein
VGLGGVRVQNVITAVFLIAAVVAILDYFGIKPNAGSFGHIVPLSKTWKLALMLGLVGVSLGLSIRSFYLARRQPKEITRIVEKEVPAQCPKQECPQETKASSPPKTRVLKTPQTARVVIPEGTKIEATTNAPDSAAVGINTGTVTVNPPANPNRTIVTYDCDGNKRTSGPAPNVGLELNMEVGGKGNVVENMRLLFNSHKYPELLEACRNEMDTSPEWLTPYLFCGLGYLGTSDGENARKMLEHYDRHTGAAYDVGACKQMSDILHSALQR